MPKRAIFLDRDGTLVHPRHYPTRPEQLVLYTGIGQELRKLAKAGFALVCVTNQSGLARGLFTESDLDLMHARLKRQLARQGARLDGIYYCPHHPSGEVDGLAGECACRKPRPGMLLQAARDLALDLRASWMVGDILDDVEAGNRAGCRTVLVDLGTEKSPTSRMRIPSFSARDTLAALRLINDVEGLGPAAERSYLPASWLSRSRVELARARA